MTDLADLLSADLLDALDRFVQDRIDAALASQPTAHDWLTVAEAAAFLRVSERTLERRIADGAVRAGGLGSRRMIHRSDLDDLARSGR